MCLKPCVCCCLHYQFSFQYSIELHYRILDGFTNYKYLLKASWYGTQHKRAGQNDC